MNNTPRKDSAPQGPGGPGRPGGRPGGPNGAMLMMEKPKDTWALFVS